MTALCEDVEGALRAAWPGERFREVREAGAGLTGQVFHARTDGWGRVAVKVSPAGTLESVNDRPKDRRAMFVQEARLLEHVRSYGLPAPHAIAVGEAPGVVMLATEWVDGDGSPAAPHELGRLCARLHRLPPPRLRLVEQDQETVGLTVAGRIQMRLEGLRRLTGEAALSPGRAESIVTAVSRPSGSRPALLHLDFRAANLLTRDGVVVGIVDWANALIFEPALELARIEQLEGRLTDDFQSGYQDLMPLPAPEPFRYLGFRLDAALMLALVFLAEAPDEGAARAALDRVRALCDRIAGFDGGPSPG